MAVKTDKALEEAENEGAEIEVGKKPEETDVQEFEGSVFDALLAAGNYEADSDEQYTIRIKREIKGKEVILLKFRIHPLTEERVEEIRKRNTTTKRDRRYGIDRKTVNNVRFRSQLIYEATVDGDREELWNNRKAWEKLGVLNGIDLIDKVLLAGEKDRVVDAIESISGFGDDGADELIKN